MANNFNTKLPPYIESDLNKQKISAPPRVRSKEIDIYIYDTNKTIREVEEATGQIAIQTKLNKTIKFNSSTPLNFDLAKPKYGKVSDTAIWGSQINGFIYEEIDIDPNNYTFFTLTKAQQTDIAQQTKYRIMDYTPTFDNKGRFLFASISAIVDSINTIQSWEKITWSLTDKFEDDVKTKYIRIELPPETMLFQDTFQFSVLPTKQTRRRQTGFKTFNLSKEFLQFLLIKPRTANPFTFDNLTFSDFLENKYSDGQYARGTLFYVGSFDTFFEKVNSKIELGFKRKPESAQLSFGTVNGGWTAQHKQNNSLYFPIFDFYEDKGGLPKSVIGAQIRQADPYIKQFFNGTLLVQNKPYPSDDKIQPFDFKKINLLDQDNEQDRKYLVLTSNIPINKYLSFSVINGRPNNAGISAIEFKWSAKSNPPKTRGIDSNSMNDIISNQESMVFEFELQSSGFSPKIKMLTAIAEQVKITTYDENHKLLTDTLFSTEFKFDDSKALTEIQL